MRYPILLLLKHHKMTPVAFAIFTEFLILATLGFLLLWSLEILLPTFVSARINLPLYLGGILSLFILHHAISVWLPQKINPLNRPLRWFLIIFLGFLSIILLILSLLKFPIPAIVIILLFCGFLGYLFRRIYSAV